LLGPDGAFYVSQDADLDEKIDGKTFYRLDAAARRKLGPPRIDAHLYARENGWAISGLVAFYAVTGDAAALADAEAAARWALKNRALAGGGFRHGEEDRGGPFLGDTLAMEQAFVDLYAATGNREWLKRGAEAGNFIAATFPDANGAFLNTRIAEADVGALALPAKRLDDQTRVARAMNLLYRYSGDDKYAALADSAMRYLVAASADLKRPFAGLLLADMEITRAPTHLTIVGRKDDPDAIRLHAAALAYPALYKRVDWWDPREGPLANPDVTYPELDRAAAFACGDHLCSPPVFTGKDLVKVVGAMAKLFPPKRGDNR